MKKIIIGLVLSFILLGCSRKEAQFNPSDNTIKILTNAEKYKDNDHLYFIRISNDSIGIFNGYWLHQFYMDGNNKKYKDYETFIKALVYEDKILSAPKEAINQYGVDYFKIEKEVTREYQKGGVSLLLNKYCVISDQGSDTMLSPKLPHAKILTAAFYLDKCGYNYSPNDLSGKKYIYKRHTIK